MAMHITIADPTGLMRFVIPVVPADVEVETERENTDFRTTRRYLRIFGTQKNRSIEWSSFFPVNKNYDFVERNSVRNGWDIHNFITRFQNNDLPMRIVVTNNNRMPVLNMLASVDKYSFKEDAANDIHYAIKLTEFTVI